MWKSASDEPIRFGDKAIFRPKKLTWNLSFWDFGFGQKTPWCWGDLAKRLHYAEPFDTTFFDTDTILIPFSNEISIPIRYRYNTGPIIPILIRYRYFRGIRILILIWYRYFMEMVWYHVWYQKMWILGYIKLFIALKPFQNDHISDILVQKTQWYLSWYHLAKKAIPIRYWYF